MDSDPLATAIARISAPDRPRDAPQPAEVTGELQRLLAWWQARSQADPRRWAQVEVEVPADADAASAIAAGIAAADRAVDSGSTLLVPRVVHPGAPAGPVPEEVTARAIIAILTRREANAVLPQPAGMADAEWMTRCSEVRDRIAQTTSLQADLMGLLDALAAADVAAVAGVLIGASARRTPCLIDGTAEHAAALIADRLCPQAKDWWRAGSDSPDPGRCAAVMRIDLEAGLPLGLADDAGLGAAATLALLDLVTR